MITSTNRKLIGNGGYSTVLILIVLALSVGAVGVPLLLTKSKLPSTDTKAKGEITPTPFTTESIQNDEEQVTLKLQAESDEMIVGDTFILEVLLENPRQLGITAYQIELAFPQGKLQVESVDTSMSSLPTDVLSKYYNESGNIHLARVNINPPDPNGSTIVLGEVTIRAEEEGPVEIVPKTVIVTGNHPGDPTGKLDVTSNSISFSIK